MSQPRLGGVSIVHAATITRLGGTERKYDQGYGSYGTRRQDFFQVWFKLGALELQLTGRTPKKSTLIRAFFGCLGNCPHA